MQTATGSLAWTFRQSLRFELQPPIYFLAVNLWLRICPSVEFARAFSLVCVLLTIPLLWATVRRFSSGLQPQAWTAALLAVSPPLLWAATEARTYALAMLLVAASTFCFARIWLEEKPPPTWCFAAWVAASYLALCSHYFTGFALLGQGMSVLMLRRRARTLATGAAILAVAMLPWLPGIVRQVLQHPTQPSVTSTTAPAGLLEVAGAILRSGLRELWRPFFFGPLPSGLLFRAVAVVGMLLLAAACWAPRNRTAVGARAAWVAFGVPVLILFTLRATGAALVSERHWLVATPAGLVAVALSAGSVSTRMLAYLARIGPIALFAASDVGLAMKISPIDYRAAGRFLTENVAPGEPVLVFPPEFVLPVAYEFPRREQLHGLPLDVTSEQYPYPDSSWYVRDGCAVLRRLSSVRDLPGRAWIVRHPRPDHGQAVLDSVLLALPHRSTEFAGVTVIGLDLSSVILDSGSAGRCTPN